MGTPGSDNHIATLTKRRARKKGWTRLASRRSEWRGHAPVPFRLGFFWSINLTSPIRRTAWRWPRWRNFSPFEAVWHSSPDCWSCLRWCESQPCHLFRATTVVAPRFPRKGCSPGQPPAWPVRPVGAVGRGGRAAPEKCKPTSSFDNA